MRKRRGNYMILFALLLPLMFGFLALAIDIGRIRVAAIQAEGAAEAAAMAALVEFREGGDIGDASSSASSAAAEARIQRAGGFSSGNEFNVALSTGEWDWDGQEWTPDGSSVNGVTVNVTQRRPLGLLFAPIFERTSAFEREARTEEGEETSTEKVISVGVRASMRPRDIVLVVDVSREMLDHLDEVQDQLSTFVDNIAGFGVDLDRVAVVAYAGDAVLHSDFQMVSTDTISIKSDVQSADLCNIDDESWYKFYRFYPTNLDPELDGDAPYNYFGVDGSPVWGGESYFAWDWVEDEETISEFIYTVEAAGDLEGHPDWAPYTAGNWSVREVLEEEQCHVWTTSLIIFNACDPRRAPACEPYDMHPDLFCHEGHYLEGDPDRFDEYRQVAEVSCPLSAVMNWGADSFDEDSDGIAGTEQPDFAYSMAGSNPGAGLGLAASVLQAAQPSRGEPTVVWITAVPPTCGPNIDPILEDDCVEAFELEMVDAIDELAEMGANTHVVVISADPLDEAYFENLVTGRGEFHMDDDAAALEDELEEVSRNIRLQVVR